MLNGPLFSVNVNRYDKNKGFNVFHPASLDVPRSNSVMFVMGQYVEKSQSLYNVSECLVFWPKECIVPQELEKRHVFVLSEDPRKEYNRFFRDNQITNHPKKREFDYIDGAYICKGAQIGTNTTIMPGVYIDSEVVIGSDTYIGVGTKVMGRAVIGNHVMIRENAVIGADGLSTDRDEDGLALTMPQFGGIIIEDNVQIGANTVIARAAIDNTIIGKGSKIDNCCFISHNVVIGENVFVVGETIMMGSSKAENNAYISGNSTIRNQVSIGENAFVGMGAVVTRNVEKNVTVKGNPAR